MKRHIGSKVAFKRCLRRFPSSSKKTPPCTNKGLLMKILYEKNVFDKEILQASRNVKPPIAKATHKALTILILYQSKGFHLCM